MRTTEPRSEPIRQPTQVRSQKRVEQILLSAKEVLAETGSSNLKMSQIASVAGISVSSIYQYFPNKSAILAALCDEYLEAFRDVVRQAFEDKPKTVTDMVNRTIELLDGYYEFIRSEPVWKDVWSGAGSDKNIEAVADADTLQNVEVIFDGSKHLFPEAEHPDYRRMLFLIITWGGKAADAGIELSEEEGKRLLDQAKIMLMDSWRDHVFPLARPEALGDFSGPLSRIPIVRRG